MPAHLSTLFLCSAFWAGELLGHYNHSCDALCSSLLDRIRLVIALAAAAPGSMASEGSVEGRTADVQVEEKKVIEDTIVLEGENVYQHKEISGIDGSEESKVEQEVSPETVAADAKEKVVNDVTSASATEEVKEFEDDKARACEVLEDKKDVDPVVGDVEKENEDIKVFGSEVSVNSEDVVENVKENVEPDKISTSEVPEVENVYQHKETSGIDGSEESKVEQKVSPEAATAVAKEKIEDVNDVTSASATEEVKEYGDDKALACEVLEDKKDVDPVVGDVKKENEDIKVSGSEVSANSEDDAVEDAKEKVEPDKISTSEDPEVENSTDYAEEETKNAAESLSESVKNPVIPPIQELESVGKETEVSKPVFEMAKATEKPSNITAEPAQASETVEQEVLAAVKGASDATGELEKKDETPEVNKVLEASIDEKVLTEIEVPCEVSKEEPNVKESIHSSPSQALDVSASSTRIEEANDDNCAGVYKEDGKNEGIGLSATESLTKELTVDSTMRGLSTVVDEAESIGKDSIAEAVEISVKPESNIEEHKEETLETEPVKEQKEENTVETEVVEEQKEEKTLETVPVGEQKEEKNVENEVVKQVKEEKIVGTNSTLNASDETGDSGDPAAEVTETYVEDVKSFEGADKVSEEQRDLDGSDFTIKAIETPSEKEKGSEVAVEPKDESVTDNVTLTQASRDIDLDGQKDEADASIREPMDNPEETGKLHTGNVEMDETKGKKEDAESTDTQKLVEPSKDGASAKTDAEVQTPEISARPKTLMSKLKRSIVKVKKAIIGKPPSSKTISAESKDEIEVR